MLMFDLFSSLEMANVNPRPNPLHANGLCLLSLDGGGVRGLSSLYILRDIMLQLSLERGSQTILRPCDVFDLIGGTSTGGYVSLRSRTAFNDLYQFINKT